MSKLSFENDLIRKRNSPQFYCNVMFKQKSNLTIRTLCPQVGGKTLRGRGSGERLSGCAPSENSTNDEHVEEQTQV